MGPVFTVEEYSEALFDDEAFGEILLRVQDAVRARSFLNGWYDRTGAHTMSADSGWWSPEIIESYSGEFALHDVWSLAQFANWKPNKARDMAELVSMETAQKSVVFNELIRPAGDDTLHILSISVESHRGVGGLALHRGQSQSPFEQSDLKALQRIERPLSRLLDMRARIEILKRENETLQSRMDHLGQAVWTVNPARTVLHANEAAEAVVRQGDLLIVRSNRLEAADVAAGRALDLAFANLAAQGSVGVVTTVLNGPERFPAAVMLINLPSRRGRREILVVLSHPDATSCASLLSQVYGLTEAEIDIALRLAHGSEIAQIAAERQTSAGTVRVQLGKICQKMDVRRQSEVVARVLALASLGKSPVDM